MHKVQSLPAIFKGNALAKYYRQPLYDWCCARWQSSPYEECPFCTFTALSCFCCTLLYFPCTFCTFLHFPCTFAAPCCTFPAHSAHFLHFCCTLAALSLQILHLYRPVLALCCTVAAFFLHILYSVHSSPLLHKCINKMSK